MKLRSPLLAAVALALLAWNTSAQDRGRTAAPVRTVVPARTAAPARGIASAVQKLGSVERTRLLSAGRSGRPEAVALGSVARRTLLTKGKSVRPGQPKRNVPARR